MFIKNTSMVTKSEIEEAYQKIRENVSAPPLFIPQR